MFPFSGYRSRYQTKTNGRVLHCRRNDDNLKSAQIHCDDDIENVVNSEKEASRDGDINGDQPVKSPIFQNGVLRTNCIDCLDRTNVAQYSYGLAAFGHQLHALGLIDVPKLDLSSPLADDLMRLYEAMGDTLALQYGGSPAHNKVLSFICLDSIVLYLIFFFETVIENFY